MKRLVWIAAAVVALVCSYAVAFTPWPAVLAIRHAFSRDSTGRNLALSRHEPPGVESRLDQRYGRKRAQLLDVYYPAGTGKKLLPAVVWVHGGAFLAGDKRDVGPYLRILAGRGYTTVSVGYAVAPGARYPGPLMDVNAALSYLNHNAAQYHIDASQVFLAGDSAGAQIAAQLAATASDSRYAAAVGVTPSIQRRNVEGVILFCGIYDAGTLDTTGAYGGFLRTVMRSYFGPQTSTDDPRFAEFSVTRHVTRNFPRAFISAGNGDPLESQSVRLADVLRERGAAVDALFFAAEREPPLPHEYQFNLDTAAGRLALARLTAFLSRY